MTYNFTATNTGDYSDTFVLTIAGNTWDTIGPASVGPLGPGEAAVVQITVTIPQEPGLGGSTLGGVIASDRFTLTAVSALDDQVVAQATETTLANVNPAVRLSGDQAGFGTVGAQVTYVFTVTNLGDYTDSFTPDRGGRLAGHALRK